LTFTSFSTSIPGVGCGTVTFAIASPWTSSPQNNPNASYNVHHITVTDVLPDGLVYVENTSTFDGDAYINCPSTEPTISGNTLSWHLVDPHTNISLVLIGEDQYFYIEFNATVNGYGNLTNRVTVDAYHCSGEDVHGEAIANVTVPQPTPGIEVEKLVKVNCGDYSNSVETSVGSEVTFKINVTNTGGTGFDNVTVVDTLPSGLSYVDGTANPEVSEQSGNQLIWYFNDLSYSDFPMEIVFNATVDECGTFENLVNVTAKHGCDTLAVNDTAEVDVVCHPNISLQKWVSLDGENWTKSLEEYLPHIINGGNKIYFKINLTNTGDIDLTGVLEDFLPPFLKYNNDSHPSPTYANDSYINWSDDLPKNFSLVITFSATPLSGGTGKNVVKATADQGVNATDSVNITLYEPYIEVNKRVRKFCPRGEWSDKVKTSGGIVEFRIDITYHGNPLDPLNYVFHNITIVDELPSVLTYIENSTSFEGDWSDWDEYYTGNLEPTVSDHTLTWDLDDIFRIPDGGTLTLYFNATVKEDADCGTFENVAIVTGNECSGMHLEGSDNATIEIPCPDVQIEKKIKDLGTGEWTDSAYIFYGDEITFNITVDNVGERDVNDITVVDPLIDNLEFISGTPEPTINENELVWSDISVRAGEKFYIEFTVRFTGVNCYGCYNNTAYLIYYVGCQEIERNDSTRFCIRNDGYPPRSHVNEIDPYWHNSAFTITATASDDETYVAKVGLYYSHSTDGENWSEWTSFGNDTDGSDGWSWEFFGADGYYKFCSIAYDAVGNKEDKTYAEEATAGIDTVPPESSVDPIVPYERDEVPIVLSYTASDDRSGVSKVILYYRYSADNETWTDWTEGERSFNAPNGNGYYEFYSIAVDVAGNAESTPEQADARCMVVLPEPLKAMITEAPESGLVGHDLTFVGGASGGYPPYTFHWDFGDGSTADGTSVTHRYLEPNTYEIVLTVTDSKNNSNSTSIIVPIYPLEELKVNITKPEVGAIYFKDRKIISIPFNLTIIIGPITISADIENAYGEISVEFIIDNESKAIVDGEPFNYTWNERAFCKHHIEVIAYDDFDGLPTRTANTSMDVFILNLALKRNKTEEETGIVKGKVYDASKPIRKPGIPGVKVTVVGRGENTFTGRCLWKKGRFSLELAPGTYTLRFEKEGYETKEMEVQVNASEVTKIEVPLNKTEPGYIKGRVYDNSTFLKRGLGGVKITIMETNDTYYTKRFIGKGKFSIKLNPGTYHLKFEKKGYVTKIVEVTVNASEVTKKNVGLDRMGTLYGRVLKKSKLLFRGIRGATVEAVNNDTGEHFSVNTSFRGKYSMELPPGNYTVTASANGYTCVTEYNVIIKPGKSKKLNFKLKKEESS